jgi:hypothetical protein
MCDVCAVFGIGDHWTDASKLAHGMFPARDIQRHRQHRRERLAIINCLLAPLGLTCDDWDGESFALYARDGRMRIASTLGDFWKEAEALSGRVLDPLTLRFDSNGATW